MTHRRRIVFVFAILGATCFTTPAADAVDMKLRANELKGLKWGMFVCWSFSTFSGKEWTPGVKDVAFFHPTGCDTDQWVRTAKEAGMGYLLLLTKHHDGFCLWDTKTTDRKVTKSPLGKDVLAETRKSCDKYGVKLAIYFSEGEWDWPSKPDGTRFQGDGGYNPKMKTAQLRELLTQYGAIEYIWFDYAVGDGGLSHAETVACCHQFQPGTLVGFNHGAAAGEISLREVGAPGPLGDHPAASYNQANEAKHPGYLLAEFTYPILPPHEGSAMWFYSLPKHDSPCLPAEKLFQDYQGAVKHGNIFSLDVGPGYDGRLRPIDVETLRAVGSMIENAARRE
jgi:alpha-L-fucosidase